MNHRSSVTSANGRILLAYALSRQLVGPAVEKGQRSWSPGQDLARESFAEHRIGPHLAAVVGRASCVVRPNTYPGAVVSVEDPLRTAVL